MEFQVEGRNLNIRKAWQEKIDIEKARLLRHHAGSVHRLRVNIEETAGHKSGGYEVRLVAGVPGDTVVVSRKGESVLTILGEAFDTLGLQLKEFQRKRRQSYAKAPAFEEKVEEKVDEV
ncbi:MAG: 30S ribosomal protein S30 [Desulfobulbaceae bacterium]|nr:MAG: 30S ribosomal protein S30 [Desulfobulbaceae bacterium]